jgi:drug/metabolite transporter (DMT)-like permease
MSTRATMFWAFAAIYLIWGSTYLAIRIGVDTMPPFFLAAVRFLLAGGLLYAWARFRGDPAPSRATWKRAAWLGLLFFVLGNGLVVWAETRVPSARTALLASTSPIWTVLIESGLAGWAIPAARVALGVVLGFGGLVVLASPAPALVEPVPPLGVAALVGASLAWALGSVFSHRRPLAASAPMATSLTMLAGGAQLALVSLAAGEWRRLGGAHVSWESWAALGYLVLFGSIIGFSAFTYLLRESTPQMVATSAYVNPVVALVLGWGLGNEQVTGRMLAGAAIILTSVVLVRWPGPGTPGGPESAAVLETGEFPVPETGERGR